jgi:hypothetical protein
MKKEILKNTIVKVDKKFDPFEQENLFYEYKLKITDEEIYQVLLLTKNIPISEQKSTYNYLNVLNFPILKNLKKQIINILDQHDFLLNDNWAQLYNKQNKHGIHNHYGSLYSGIIYLMGKNPSPTIFYGRNFFEYSHNFKEKTLLLFPSMTPHEVLPLEKDEERLVISFNTKLT